MMVERNRHPAGRLYNMLFGLSVIADGLIRVVSLGYLHSRLPLTVSRKAPDCSPGPLEVSVVGMSEFDVLLDHIYEEGTSSEGVVHLTNKLVHAAIQSHRDRSKHDTR